MKRFGFSFLFLLLAAACFGQVGELPGEHTTEPGAFFFAEYAREPWRLPESPSQLFLKSGEIAACLAGTLAALSMKKRKT